MSDEKKHSIRLVLSPQYGVMAEIVCHSPEGCTTDDLEAWRADVGAVPCALREMWEWDGTVSLENYDGEKLVLLDAPLSLLSAGEFGVESWDLGQQSADNRTEMDHA